uniref:Uncharacterized protein n=1 Tax=Dulem virus 36 TaxID=3145754 RepID=A0AAU8AZ25_9CAUD
MYINKMFEEVMFLQEGLVNCTEELVFIDDSYEYNEAVINIENLEKRLEAANRRWRKYVNSADSDSVLVCSI